ncbi:hypothetical protein Pelo_3799 [Pelomyxa schiedti]|nr:hypothetical protein Pelo_3799 [Pelomyxa schiedti]
MMTTDHDDSEASPASNPDPAAVVNVDQETLSVPVPAEPQDKKLQGDNDQVPGVDATPANSDAVGDGGGGGGTRDEHEGGLSAALESRTDCSGEGVGKAEGEGAGGGDAGAGGGAGERGEAGSAGPCAGADGGGGGGGAALERDHSGSRGVGEEPPAELPIIPVVETVTHTTAMPVSPVTDETKLEISTAQPDSLEPSINAVKDVDTLQTLEATCKIQADEIHNLQEELAQMHNKHSVAVAELATERERWKAREAELYQLREAEVCKLRLRLIPLQRSLKTEKEGNAKSQKQLETVLQELKQSHQMNEKLRQQLSAATQQIHDVEQSVKKEADIQIASLKKSLELAEVSTKELEEREQSLLEEMYNVNEGKSKLEDKLKSVTEELEGIKQKYADLEASSNKTKTPDLSTKPASGSKKPEKSGGSPAAVTHGNEAILQSELTQLGIRIGEIQGEKTYFEMQCKEREEELLTARKELSVLKGQVVQAYISAHKPGARSSPAMDIDRATRAKRRGQTETSLQEEVTSKLQSVLQESILNTFQLKHDMEIMGQEILRLQEENQKLRTSQPTAEHTTETTTPPMDSPTNTNNKTNTPPPCNSASRSNTTTQTQTPPTTTKPKQNTQNP